VRAPLPSAPTLIWLGWVGDMRDGRERAARATGRSERHGSSEAEWAQGV
jgi:hypothetical protein